MTALVPLSAGPNKSDTDEKIPVDDINISSSHPTKTEWFEVDERVESEELNLQPDIMVNALGNGVHLSGMGKTKRFHHNQSYRIKLDPSKTTIEGLPTLLKLWVI